MLSNHAYTFSRTSNFSFPFSAINATFAGFHFVHSPCSFACKQFKFHFFPRFEAIYPTLRRYTSNQTPQAAHTWLIKSCNWNRSRANIAEPERITLVERWLEYMLECIKTMMNNTFDFCVCGLKLWYQLLFVYSWYLNFSLPFVWFQMYTQTDVLQWLLIAHSELF